MNKTNCWEFKKCGRESGGANVREFGVCPAALEKKVDGIHGGKNGGRVCWAIAGTYCYGKVQGTYANKLLDCIDCNFYKLVRVEQGGSQIVTTRTILENLKTGIL